MINSLLDCHAATILPFTQSNGFRIRKDGKYFLCCRLLSSGVDLHELCDLLILMIVLYYNTNLVKPLIFTASTSFISTCRFFEIWKSVIMICLSLRMIFYKSKQMYPRQDELTTSGILHYSSWAIAKRFRRRYFLRYISPLDQSRSQDRNIPTWIFKIWHNRMFIQPLRVSIF